MLRLDINLLFTVCNILIWFILIKKFLFKPVNNILEKREELIQSRYDEAQQAQNAANEQKEKYETLQAGIAEEKAQVMQKAEEEARAAYQQIVDDANGQAEKIIGDSRKSAALEHDKIVARAEKEIRSMLFDAVSAGKSEKADDKALYDQFLTKAGEKTDAES